MKNNYKLLVTLLLVTTLTFAQTTVLYDFGGVFGTTLTTGMNYNNMTEDLYSTHVGDHSVADLIDDTGASTGFSFAITADFEYLNETGTVATTGAAAFFPATATKDSFFTNSNGNGNGEVTFSGLDNSKFYSFEIFSSRKTTSNREGQFTITGLTTEVGYLNAGGTTAEGNTSNTVIISGVQPSGGAISIALEAGPNNTTIYSYMNCLKMIETSTASVEDDILANGGLQVYPNPVGNELSINYVLNDTSKSTILIYDVTGRLVYDATNALNQAGTYSYKWNRLDNNGKRADAGVYFLTLKTNTTSVSKKLILK